MCHLRFGMIHALSRPIHSQRHHLFCIIPQAPPVFHLVQRCISQNGRRTESAQRSRAWSTHQKAADCLFQQSAVFGRCHPTCVPNIIQLSLCARCSWPLSGTSYPSSFRIHPLVFLLHLMPLRHPGRWRFHRVFLFCGIVAIFLQTILHFLYLKLWSCFSPFTRRLISYAVFGPCCSHDCFKLMPLPFCRFTVRIGCHVVPAYPNCNSRTCYIYFILLFHFSCYFSQ